MASDLGLRVQPLLVVRVEVGTIAEGVVAVVMPMEVSHESFLQVMQGCGKGFNKQTNGEAN
jgi:hypothetical protein